MGENEKEPQGHRATVILEWDYSLGPAWINTENLRNLLFTPLETNPGFLRVIEFEPPPIPEPVKDPDDGP